MQAACASTEAAIRARPDPTLSGTSFQSQAHTLDMLYMLELRVLWIVNKEQSRSGKAGGKVDRNDHTHLTTMRRKAAVKILGKTCKINWARVINQAFIVKEIWSYELQFIFEGRVGIHWKKVKEIVLYFNKFPSKIENHKEIELNGYHVIIWKTQLPGQAILFRNGSSKWFLMELKLH